MNSTKTGAPELKMIAKEWSLLEWRFIISIEIEIIKRHSNNEQTLMGTILYE